MSFTKVNLKEKTQKHNPSNLNGYKFNSALTAEQVDIYKYWIWKLRPHYSLLINEFHMYAGNPPYTHIDFLDFIDQEFGISSSIIGYDPEEDFPVSGTWFWTGIPNDFVVYLNMSHPEVRRNVTVLHEAFHVIQDWDEEFKCMINEIPEDMQLKIVERIAELSAIETVIPAHLIIKDKRDNLSPYAVAIKYGISVQMATIALK